HHHAPGVPARRAGLARTATLPLTRSHAIRRLAHRALTGNWHDIDRATVSHETALIAAASRSDAPHTCCSAHDSAGRRVLCGASAHDCITVLADIECACGTLRRNAHQFAFPVGASCYYSAR